MQSSTSCARGTTPLWPTPPKTIKQSSCWMQVAPKRDRSVEEASSVSVHVKVMEGTCLGQRCRCKLLPCSTYLVISED